MSKVEISYYSDVLCIWAYVAERRLDELAANFGDEIEIVSRYCSVFPDAWGKIEGKGGFESFNRHLREVASRYPHIAVNDAVWLRGRPRSSASPHLFLKAVELVERDHGGSAAKQYLERLSTRAAREMRRAFFVEAIDIADWQVHRDIAARIGTDYDAVEARLRSSEAIACLALDYDLSQRNGIEGSPTFVMNEGRQKLFGNVGYRLLEANVQELLRQPDSEHATWC